MIRPLVKYHGGKGRIFKWIIPFFPDHQKYCEPFGGAASVLLNKTPAPIEIYNDVEPKIVNLLKTVRDDFEKFLDAISLIQYDRDTYEKHRAIYRSDNFGDLTPLQQAITTYVAKRMSRGGLCGTFSWSSRIYSEGPAEVHCWNSAKKNIVEVHDRLQNVDITQEDAKKVIRDHDGPDTLFYLDPPYLHSTRFSHKLYDYEMTASDHEALLRLCLSLEAKIVLSGYPSEIYTDCLKGWRTTTKTTANHSSHCKKKKETQETIWMNF